MPLMLWFFAAVLSLKRGFQVCGSRGVRVVHVFICKCVVQIGVTLRVHTTVLKEQELLKLFPLLVTVKIIVVIISDQIDMARNG